LYSSFVAKKAACGPPYPTEYQNVVLFKNYCSTISPGGVSFTKLKISAPLRYLISFAAALAMKCCIVMNLSNFPDIEVLLQKIF
jgi:hypothetical protein